MWRSLICGVVVLLLAGCGGGAASGEGDPATAVPADAVLYAEAVVRPEGAQREDALAAAGKVLGTDDPQARLRELLGDEVDYERDLQPWLGSRAGVWASRPDSGVAILAATDTEAAMESIEAMLQRDGQTLTQRSHGDVEYVVSSDDVAAGVVGDFAAIGDEADLKRTIDAFEGESLADREEYGDAVDGDPLAMFWADTRGLFELAEDPELQQLRAVVPLDELPPVVGGFTADGETLALDVSTRAALPAGGTPLVQELPGDAWLAMGAADVGESVRDSLARFGGGLGGVAARAQVQQELGLDLDRDLLDWIGDAAVFVRGTGAERLDGGIVVQSTSDERAADAFGRILGALQQARGTRARPISVAGAGQAFAIADEEAPMPTVFARGSGLVVLTFGVAAAEAALGTGDRLGETELYASAEELADGEPSLLVSMPQLLEFMDSVDAEEQPYLEAISVVAVGLAGDGDEFTARVGAGLR